MRKWFKLPAKRKEKSWSADISHYLGIPEDEVIKSLGKLTGNRQEDKIRFSEKYDNGKRIITTINRDAEKRGELSTSWTGLKYVAVRQEWAAFQRFQEMQDVIIPLIRKYVPSRKSCILDYGCGTSLFGRLLLKDQPSYRVTLCDVDGYHLRFAASECRKLAPQTECMVVEGDNFIPVFSKKFDFIYSWTVFEHVPNVMDVLKALVGALATNGCLLETFGGETGEIPEADSADSEKAWEQRDECFHFLMHTHELIYGKMPEETCGHFGKSKDFRIWKKRAAV